MHTAGQQLAEATVEEAVVRDLGARRSLPDAPSGPAVCDFDQEGIVRHDPAQRVSLEAESRNQRAAQTVLVNLDYESPSIDSFCESIRDGVNEPVRPSVQRRRAPNGRQADLASADQTQAAVRSTKAAIPGVRDNAFIDGSIGNHYQFAGAESGICSGPTVGYDGTSVREDIRQPSVCSPEERRARMRQLANVFIEMFHASGEVKSKNNVGKA